MDTNKILTGVAAGLVVVLALWFLQRHREIERIHSALKSATSWEADMTYNLANRSGGSKVEVVCPDRMRMENSGMDYSRTIRVGNKYWEQGLGGGTGWTAMPPEAEMLPTPCLFDVDQPLLARSPAAKAAAIAAEFDREVRIGASFSKKNLETTSDGSCRWWTVADSYNLCVDEATSLPMRFEYSFSGNSVKATFSRWNGDITIEAPQ